MDNRNNDSDKNVEQAIDDIFGSDFIEIDVNGNKEKPDSETKEKEFFIDKDQALFSSDFDSSASVNIFDNKNFNRESENLMTPDEPPIIPGDSSLKNDSEEDGFPTVMDDDQTKKKDNKTTKVKGNDDRGKNKNLMIVIWFIIGILFIIGFVFIIFNFIIKRENVVNCSYSAEDTGYKVTDEYKITRQGEKIKYVDGKYTYKAKNGEYVQQVEYVKNERIPAIINSNGMPGFTYQYETGTDYFSVSSYLDFTMFDYAVIDKNKADVKPISYITINSKTTYDSLIKELEDQGYKCTASK